MNQDFTWDFTWEVNTSAVSCFIVWVLRSLHGHDACMKTMHSCPRGVWCWGRTPRDTVWHFVCFLHTPDPPSTPTGNKPEQKFKTTKVQSACGNYCKNRPTLSVCGKIVVVNTDGVDLITSEKCEKHPRYQLIDRGLGEGCPVSSRL